MMQQQRTRAAVLLLLGLGLLASCLTQAFMVPMPLSMRVGRSTNTQRSKSVGILNSMRENINSQANPNQVMISNLPFDTTQQELEAFAAQAGEVVSTKIIVDRETGRSKGYGFVLYTEPLGATYALEKLDGQELGGRPLKIRPAMRKPNNYGGGGGYGGGDGGY